MTWASLIGPCVKRRFEGADVEPVRLQRDRHQLDAEPLQHQQRAVVGRLLDDDPVAGLEQVLEQHPPGLQRPVGDHHLPGIEPAVPLGDPLAEPGMPDPGAVGERLLPVLGKRHRGSLPHRVLAAGCRRSGAPRANEIVSFAIASEHSNAPARWAAQPPRSTSTAICAVSVGLSPTRTPFASSASFFACAVPEEPEMIAPAWPICLPGGAVKPAM